MSSSDSSQTSPPPTSPPSSTPQPRDRLEALLQERASIEPLRLVVPNLWTLLQNEIIKASAPSTDPASTNPASSLPSPFIRSSPIPNPLTRRPSAPILSRRRVRIPVPADKYPEYNFVGRLLGPRGTTLKTLERDTACKIMIRGKGSIRKDKEPAIRGKPGWEHVFNEALHVVIEVDDSRLDDTAAARALNKAKEAVELLLVPVPEERDGLKRQQLRALAIMNGTYRGAPARSHDQLPLSSFSSSPSLHSQSMYPQLDTSSPHLCLTEPLPAPLSSTVLPNMAPAIPKNSPHQNPLYKSHDAITAIHLMKNGGQQSPSSGATSPKTFDDSMDPMAALTSNMHHCAVDELATSSVGDDSPESSHSSELGEPSTHVIGNGYGTEQLKVSPVSPRPASDTSLSFGGFIGNEFYNGAFSNGATFPSPWENHKMAQAFTSDQITGTSPFSSGPYAPGPYAFSPPSSQVLTTNTTTVTPTDRQGGY